MKTINRTIIFSTRYPYNGESSIFDNVPGKTDQHLINEKCRIITKNINEYNVLQTFQMEAYPQGLREIVKILKTEDPKAEFDEMDIEYLKSDIIDFFLDHPNLTEKCCKSLARYIFRNENSKSKKDYSEYYLIKDTVNEEDNKIVYRIVGIMHLPDDQGDEDKQQWVSTLLKTFSFGNNIDEEEIYLCLHTRTDYEGGGNGFCSEASKKYSDSESKNISIFLFHHEPDIYPVAKVLKMTDSKLNQIWDELNKIKKHGTI